MDTCRRRLLASCIVMVLVSPVAAGDLYWSTLDFVNVWDVDVCGTTVYVATQSGMYRTWGDPEQWHEVWPGEVSRVACDGSTVLFVPGREWEGPVRVSHDNLQTFQATTGLDSLMYLGVEDMDVVGSTAIVAFDHGLFRSTDGGDSFSIHSVLWDSSGDYDLKTVWTNGTECVTAGSGGFTYGIWYSPTCERDTFTVVAPVGGQNWLTGSGDTLVSGSYYNDQMSSTAGYYSTDAGASWNPAPWWIGAVNPDFNRPYLSGSLILSSTSYDVYDPDLDDFVGHLDGLYLADLLTSDGTDMKDGYPDTDEIWFHAIVDTPDPWLLIAESLDVWAPISPGQVRWFRSPGGWPSPLDLAPPSAGDLTASPSLGRLDHTPSASLALAATNATWTYLVAARYTLSADWVDSTIWTSTDVVLTEVSDGWEPYAAARSAPLASPGQYDFHAWYGDDDGLVSDPSAWDGVTVLPASLNLGEHQCVGYWLHGRAGESFTFGAASPGGGGDLDVLWWWVPGYGWAGSSAYAGVNDSLTVTTPEDGFYDLYLCNYPGNGTFNGGLVATGGSLDLMGPMEGRRRNTPPTGTDATMSDGQTGFADWLDAWSDLFHDGFESGDTTGWSASSS